MSNSILPFASGASEGAGDILTQEAYEQDAQRLSGNRIGPARRALINKALRQSSLLAAAVAEFISSVGGVNIVDTLTPSDIAGQLVDAINSMTPGARGNHTFSVLSGTTGTITVPSGGRFMADVTAATTLVFSPAPTGSNVVEFQLLLQQTGAFAVTLPAGTKVPEGSSFAMPSGAGKSLLLEGVKYGTGPWLVTFAEFPA